MNLFNNYKNQYLFIKLNKIDELIIRAVTDIR
jgi:hypothetical protein